MLLRHFSRDSENGFKDNPGGNSDCNCICGFMVEIAHYAPILSITVIAKKVRSAANAIIASVFQM